MSDTPAEVEATGDETVQVVWLGESVDLPATADDWDINVTRAFKDQDIIGVLEQLVGQDRFAKIEKAHRAAHGGKMLNRDLIPLGDEIAKIYGFERSGNS